MDNLTDRERDSESNEFTENGDNRLTETGWKDEREYLFNGKGIEENEEYIGRTEKEMDTDIDWSTDSNTNPILDSIYTLASAAEIIRKPTTKTPRQTRNKKKGLGQREDDHSRDYQNNNHSTTDHLCNKTKVPVSNHRAERNYMIIKNTNMGNKPR